MSSIVAKVSIPKGLASVIVGDSVRLKAYATFYQLKSVYVGGVLINYRQQLPALAQRFGRCERTLRKFISILKADGLVSVQGGKNLVLRSSKVLAARHNVSQKKFWPVKTECIKDMDEVLLSLALEEKMSTQTYELRKKVLDRALEEVGITNLTAMQPHRARSLRKRVSGQFDHLLKQAKTRYINSASTFTAKSEKLNPFVTLSRQGVANTLGYTSKQTGQAIVKRLEKLGYLTDEYNTVFVGEFSYDQYQRLQATVLDHDYSYRFKDGVVFKQLSNLLTVNKGLILFNS